ncbi:hypothetical protein GWK47_036668 [Chionoecetes opilio]|uniref:Uncharacterized protein n=1 Tax=Chionoecetes opilio TaxID=41210 RepID=A0A8J4YR90_CHIOP|nr:hypothetical protein GWK47_036668 [Chionoecetes opilio]
MVSRSCGAHPPRPLPRTPPGAGWELRVPAPRRPPPPPPTHLPGVGVRWRCRGGFWGVSCCSSPFPPHFFYPSFPRINCKAPGCRVFSPEATSSPPRTPPCLCRTFFRPADCPVCWEAAVILPEGGPLFSGGAHADLKEWWSKALKVPQAATSVCLGGPVSGFSAGPPKVVISSRLDPPDPLPLFHDSASTSEGFGARLAAPQPLTMPRDPQSGTCRLGRGLRLVGVSGPPHPHLLAPGVVGLDVFMNPFMERMGGPFNFWGRFRHRGRRSHACFPLTGCLLLSLCSRDDYRVCSEGEEDVPYPSPSDAVRGLPPWLPVPRPFLPLFLLRGPSGALPCPGGGSLWDPPSSSVLFPWDRCPVFACERVDGGFSHRSLGEGPGAHFPDLEVALPGDGGQESFLTAGFPSLALTLPQSSLGFLGGRFGCSGPLLLSLVWWEGVSPSWGEAGDARGLSWGAKTGPRDEGRLDPPKWGERETTMCPGSFCPGPRPGFPRPLVAFHVDG